MQYTTEQWEEIQAKHLKWLCDEDGGERADLSFADLRSADLRSADLSSADLSYANLRSADLRSADLSCADLRYANLRSADLRSADLSCADLRSADLSCADLRYADIHGHKINGPVMQSSGFGSENRTTLAFTTEDGIYIICGCWKGMLTEFRVRVSEVYANNLIRREYELMADMFEARAKRG